MFRPLTALVVVVLLAATSSPAAAEDSPEDGPETIVGPMFADAAVPGLLEELALIGETGAFEPNSVAEFVTDWMDFPSDLRVEVLDELEYVDESNQSLLDGLDDAESLSDEVIVAMSKLPQDELDGINRGELAFIDPEPWLDGLSDLIVRRGFGPDQRQGVDHDVIIEILRTYEREGDFNFDNWFEGASAPAPTSTQEPLVQAAQAEPQTETAGERDATPRVTGTVGAVPAPENSTVAQSSSVSSSDNQLPWLTLLVALAVLLIGGGALLTAIRRRAMTSDASIPPRAAVQDGNNLGLTDVLETSRRMTAALDVAEIQRIAVADSVRLTRAEAGAFVARHPEGAMVAVTSTPSLFSDSLITAGALCRVMETGQSAQLVTDNDPALVRVPVALAAVPVIAAGGVAGAIVVIRTANTPFTASDVAALDLLAPVTGTALRAAAAHRSAVTAADIDSLTKVHNRRRLDRDLAQLGSSSTAGFAMIDVDHFKRFNDTHGHPAGDVALQIVASTIVSNVRDEDVVYRYGGEEFSVLMAACDTSEALNVLERVRVAVSTTPVPGANGDPEFVTISIGVAAGGTDSPTDLPRFADQALYAAKSQGRDRVVTTT